MSPTIGSDAATAPVAPARNPVPQSLHASSSIETLAPQRGHGQLTSLPGVASVGAGDGDGAGVAVAAGLSGSATAVCTAAVGWVGMRTGALTGSGSTCGSGAGGRRSAKHSEHHCAPSGTTAL